VNLLPAPRSVELLGGMAPWREPVTAIDAELPHQGYVLTVAPQEIRLVAADDAGAFYGRATLRQLRHIHGDDALPCGTIHDSPDIPIRGVMLDVSRDKVPTMATLRAIVDRLASWKINHVELYMEHTFAYRDHREVWEHAGPFTSEEIRELDAYCRGRHVELSANQNCLGHMQRWLSHDRYRAAAIIPEGWTIDGRHHGPLTLDPSKPASLALVRELLGELVGNFTSRRVHVGLDEPWELPDERIDDYLAWVRALRALPELEGREMLMWGDMLRGKPDRIAALPDGVTVCEWGYEDWWPLEDRAATLEAADRPFWLCPGTSSWLTILGRVTNMRGNCANAAVAAVAHGAGGMLVTDWGDQGHLQYLPISDPGFAYAAGVSWCHDTNRDLDLAAALSTHAYDDPTGELGTALVELGDVHRLVTPQWPNQSMLIMHLYSPELAVGTEFTAGLTADELRSVADALDRAEERLDRARPGRTDGGLVVDELRNAIALVRLLVRDAAARLAGDGRLESMGGTVRLALADALRPVISEHERLWRARNRVGGLRDSTAWLRRLLRCYETGSTGDDRSTAEPLAGD